MLHSDQCWKCHDISSTFRVSGHPNTISAYDNRLEEKSRKIGQNRRYIDNISVYKRYISDNFNENQLVEQTHMSLCFF